MKVPSYTACDVCEKKIDSGTGTEVTIEDESAKELCDPCLAKVRNVLDGKGPLGGSKRSRRPQGKTLEATAAERGIKTETVRAWAVEQGLVLPRVVGRLSAAIWDEYRQAHDLEVEVAPEFEDYAAVQASEPRRGSRA